MTMRITPLPLYYAQMKLDHLAHWEAKGFKGYQSPWIPVWESNRHLIQTGDLIMDTYGIERPHQIDRDCQKIRGGRVVKIVRTERYRLVEPAFLWADVRTKDVLPYLRDNPREDDYREHSADVERLLRSGYKVVDDVRFPLFHETSLEHAANIVMNGIDIGIVEERDCREFGAAFCACIDLKSTVGKGNFNGAVVKLNSWQGRPPRWLNMDIVRPYLPRRVILYHELSRCLKERQYIWRIVASELSASSILSGVSVFINDSFEQYVPVEIIEMPQG